MPRNTTNKEREQSKKNNVTMTRTLMPSLSNCASLSLLLCRWLNNTQRIMKGGNNNEKQQQKLHIYCAGYTRIYIMSGVARGEWVGGFMFQHFQLFPNVFVLRFYLLYPGLSNMSGYFIHPFCCRRWRGVALEFRDYAIKYQISDTLSHL